MKVPVGPVTPGCAGFGAAPDAANSPGRNLLLPHPESFSRQFFFNFLKHTHTFFFHAPHDLNTHTHICPHASTSAFTSLSKPVCSELSSGPWLPRSSSLPRPGCFFWSVFLLAAGHGLLLEVSTGCWALGLVCGSGVSESLIKCLDSFGAYCEVACRSA